MIDILFASYSFPLLSLLSQICFKYTSSNQHFFPILYTAPVSCAIRTTGLIPSLYYSHTMLCSFYISSLSKRKSITLIFKMPLSSYQRFPISFLTTILGKESPVSVNGLSSTSAFSSVGIAYADWI